MRFRAIGKVSLLSVALVAGCSSSPDPGIGPVSAEPVGASASAIQGGTVDPLHPFAVGICGTIGGGTKGHCTLFCSGALIAPNLVVTARHCVFNSPEVIDCTTAKFGAPLDTAGNFYITTDASMAQATLGWHKVQSVVAPPDTHFCGNDIALLVLSDNVSASEATPLTPIVQYPMTDHDRYTSDQTAIGYGITSPDTKTQGVRHIRQSIPITCLPGDTSGLDCASTAALLAQRNIAENEYEAGDGTCSGDSGSSAIEQSSFESGMPASFGVLSRGGVSDDGKTCVGAVYTRLDKWRDLIVSTVTAAAAAGKYAVPSWTAAIPGGDAGMVAPPDAAVAKPAPAALGQPCTQDDECGSTLCRSAPGSTLVCSQSCSGTATCPGGYACQKSFCFAHAAEAAPTPAATPQQATTTTSGCSAAPGGNDPARSAGWFAVLGAVVAFAALRRKTARILP